MRHADKVGSIMLKYEDMERGRLWSRSPQYKKKVDGAYRIIESALDKYDPMYVSFSCGKDSAVMFDLVRDINPDIEGRFIRWPETKWIDNFDEIIEAWTQLGAKVSVLDLHRGSLSESVPDRWIRLRNKAPSKGAFVGLRADESRARMKTLRIHGTLFEAKDGFARCCPVAFFNTNDIAARIVERKLPILSTYGFSGIESRTVARVPRSSVLNDFITELHERDLPALRQLQLLYSELG